MTSRRRRIAAASVVLAAAVIAVLVARPASAAPPPSSGCADVETIAVRGTTEPGTVGGGLQPLANAITSGAKQTVSTYGLPYPATADWQASSGKGIALLKERLAGQAQACPNQRFVLLGYSQGAWVVGDVLASAANPRVAAVILYGDPRFTAGEPFNVGTAKAGVSGVYPRAKGALSGYADRVRSYCDAGDTVCQSGASGTDHFTYGQTRTADASKFVLAKLAGTTTAPPSSSPAPSAPPSAPPSTTPTTPPTAPGTGGFLGWLKKVFPWLPIP